MADERITRIFEAVRRSIQALPSASRAQVSAQLKPESSWALAIILGVWAGLQLLPAGPLVGSIRSAAGGLSLSPVFSSLSAAVIYAAGAKDAAQQDRAGRELLAVWQRVGIENITELTSSSQFRQLQGQILTVLPYSKPAVEKKPAQKPAKVNASPIPSPPIPVPAAPPGGPAEERGPTEDARQETVGEGSDVDSTDPPSGDASTESPQEDAAVDSVDIGSADPGSSVPAVSPDRGGNMLEGRLHRLGNTAARPADASSRAGSIAVWTLLGTGLAALGVGAVLAAGSRRRSSSL